MIGVSTFRHSGRLRQGRVGVGLAEEEVDSLVVDSVVVLAGTEVGSSEVVVVEISDDISEVELSDVVVDASEDVGDEKDSVDVGSTEDSVELVDIEVSSADEVEEEEEEVEEDEEVDEVEDVVEEEAGDEGCALHWPNLFWQPFPQ